jgi:Protein of unknown function (DUF1573)
MKFLTYSTLSFALSFCLACGNNDEALREAALKSLDSVAAERAMEVTAPLPESTVPTDHIEPKGPSTKIDFLGKDKFKFGKINEGDKVTHDFEFKNTGIEPLLITNCKASCGCTVPEWSKEPVAPGGSGKIHVVFNSEHKPGTQVKTVTVTANTEPTRSIIAVVGEVIPKK